MANDGALETREVPWFMPAIKPASLFLLPTGLQFKQRMLRAVPQRYTPTHPCGPGNPGAARGARATSFAVELIPCTRPNWGALGQHL